MSTFYYLYSMAPQPIIKPSYTTIDSVVRSYIADNGENTLHNYIRYLKFGFDGLKKWHLRSYVEDLTVRLEMDAKKSVPLPEDCIVPNKVGVQYGDRIFTYPFDNSISYLFTQGDGGKLDKNKEYDPGDMRNTDAFYFYNYIDPYGWTGWLLSNGHNDQGYCRINWRAREIQFSADVRTSTVYLEYKSSGFNPKTRTQISEGVELLIREYINWQVGRRKFGDGSVETRERKKEYYQQETETASYFMSGGMSYAQILDIQRRTHNVNKAP